MKIWLTPWHPPHRNVLEKNCLSQIECWNLENEAKTTRKVHNLSVNFVVPTSCQLTPYYSLSLSRISSTSQLNIRISRTKPKRHAMHSICPLILLMRLAASCSRITLWAWADKLHESFGLHYDMRHIEMYWKKLSELNWHLESRERRKNDTQS